MYFDYLLYVDVCLVDASEGFVLAILAIFVLIIHLFKKSREKALSLLDLIILPFIIVMELGIGVLGCGGTLIHGIYLLEETKEDDVEIYGDISNMKSINDFNRRFVKYEYGYDEISGTVFTIDGIKCTAPLNCGLEVGDHVYVRYLPKSGYILYISKTDDS